MLRCPICNRPRDARYENSAAGEACVDPCHWPYLSAADVARASIALDRIRRLPLLDANSSNPLEASIARLRGSES